MATLYIRDVPDDVADTLRRRAAAAGQSLSAHLAQELAKLTTRPTNAEMVERLRRRDRSEAPTSEEIVAAVRSGRR